MTAHVDHESPEALTAGHSAPASHPAITTLHTVGPDGGSCARAAQHWLERSMGGQDGRVELFDTMADAAAALAPLPEAALLGCVALDGMHSVVIDNLHRLVLADCFVLHTADVLVLAARHDRAARLRTIAGPATLTRMLLDDDHQPVDTRTTADAAGACAEARTDGCVTTPADADRHGLATVETFGRVPLGFTVHRHRTGVDLR